MMLDGPSRSMRRARRNARRLVNSTPKRLRSGWFRASARRKAPLPGPISISTGLVVPKISAQVGGGVEKSVREMRIGGQLYISEMVKETRGGHAVLVATLRKRYSVQTNTEHAAAGGPITDLVYLEISAA